MRLLACSNERRFSLMDMAALLSGAARRNGKFAAAPMRVPYRYWLFELGVLGVFEPGLFKPGLPEFWLPMLVGIISATICSSGSISRIRSGSFTNSKFL